MGSTVDQPCLVEGETHSEKSRNEESVEESFIPTIHGDDSRQNKATDQNERYIESKTEVK